MTNLTKKAALFFQKLEGNFFHFSLSFFMKIEQKVDQQMQRLEAITDEIWLRGKEFTIKKNKPFTLTGEETPASACLKGFIIHDLDYFGFVDSTKALIRTIISNKVQRISAEIGLQITDREKASNEEFIKEEALNNAVYFSTNLFVHLELLPEVRKLLIEKELEIQLLKNKILKLEKREHAQGQTA